MILWMSLARFLLCRFTHSGSLIKRKTRMMVRIHLPLLQNYPIQTKRHKGRPY